MRQTFTLPIPSSFANAGKASLIGAMLPNGAPPVAVSVDNPSGFWLQVHPLGSQIPPYTIGWASSFGVKTPSIDVLFLTTGPAPGIIFAPLGQSSTVAGDPVVVTLYDADEAPQDSVGYPYGIHTATALTDATVNPNVPAAAAFLMTWDPITATWRRVATGTGLTTTPHAALAVVRAGTTHHLATQPASNTAPLLTFANPGSPRVWQLDYVVATLRNGGGVATALSVSVWDGNVGTGTELLRTVMSIGATAGTIDRIILTGLGIKGSVANNLNVTTSGPPGASNFAELNAGAILSGV